MKKQLILFFISIALAIEILAQSPPTFGGNNLKLWLDPSSYTVNPSGPDTWNDLSGNNNHVSSVFTGTIAGVAGGVDPTHVPGVSVNFSGNSLMYNASSPLTNVTGTVFVVASNISNGTGDALISMAQLSSNPPGNSSISYLDNEMVIKNNNAYSHDYPILSNVNISNYIGRVSPCVPSSTSDLRVVTGVWHNGGFGTNSLDELTNQKTSSTFNSSVLGQPILYLPSSRSLFIGARIFNGVLFDQAYASIHEIIVYDRVLNATEIEDVNKYLRCRWNINYINCNDIPACSTQVTTPIRNLTHIATHNNEILSSSINHNITPKLTNGSNVTSEFYVSSSIGYFPTSPSKIISRPKISKLLNDKIVSENYYVNPNVDNYQFNHLGIKYQKETNANYSFGRIEPNVPNQFVNSHESDMFVMKTDLTGAVVWSKSYHFPVQLGTPIIYPPNHPLINYSHDLPKIWPTSFEVITVNETPVANPDPWANNNGGLDIQKTYITITGRIEFPGANIGSHGFIMQLDETGNVLWTSFFAFETNYGNPNKTNRTYPTKITHIPGQGFHITGGASFEDFPHNRLLVAPDRDPHCFQAKVYRNATINFLINYQGDNIIWENSFESRMNEVPEFDCVTFGTRLLRNSQNRGSSAYLDETNPNDKKLYILGADYDVFTNLGHPIKFLMINKIDLNNGSILAEKQYQSEQILTNFYPPTLDGVIVDENFEQNINKSPFSTAKLMISGYHHVWTSNRNDIGFYPFTFEIDKFSLSINTPNTYTVYNNEFNSGYRYTAFDNVYHQADAIDKYHPTMSYFQDNNDFARYLANGHIFSGPLVNAQYNLHIGRTNALGYSECKQISTEILEFPSNSVGIDFMFYARPNGTIPNNEQYTAVSLSSSDNNDCQTPNGGGGNQVMSKRGDQSMVPLDGRFTLNIYPNPTSDVVYFNFDENSFTPDMSSISIKSVDGKMISGINAERENTKVKVDVKSLASAVYMLSVTDENTQKTYSKLFVKE